jgi:hypothetical protein
MSKLPPDPRIELLPGAIRPVAEICGFDHVERLIETLGGTRIYVPRDNVSAVVVQRCGADVARALSRCYGGEYIVLPLARTLKAARRRAAIRNDARSANEIALAYGISVGSVYRMRGARPGPAALPAPKSRKIRGARDERTIDIEEFLDRQAARERPKS